MTAADLLRKKFENSHKPLVFRSLDFNIDKGEQFLERSRSLAATQTSSATNLSSKGVYGKLSMITPKMLPSTENKLLQRQAASEAALTRSKAYHSGYIGPRQQRKFEISNQISDSNFEQYSLHSMEDDPYRLGAQGLTLHKKIQGGHHCCKPRETAN